MAPGALSEGSREAGIGQRRGCQTAPKCTQDANSPLRDRIFPRKTLLCPSRSHHSRRRLSRIPSRKTTSRQRRFVQRFLKDTSDYQFGLFCSIGGLPRSRSAERSTFRVCRA